MLIGVGVVTLLTSNNRPNDTSPQTPLPSVALLGGDEKPSEIKPDPGMNYQVPDNHPRRIILPKVGISGFVQRVGVNDKGELAVPSNIHAAGWFDQRPAPGEKGLSIIDGHVQGRYEPGIFKRLSELAEGDIVEIEMGDYSVRTFKVIETKTVSQKQANDKLYEKSVPRQLNLVTCIGLYDDATETYDQRFIVYAEYYAMDKH